MVQRSYVAWKKRLVGNITCPNCWHGFPPEDIKYIARQLTDDPVLGSTEYLRFSPTRFTVEGLALDPQGQPTGDLACPRCHLQIPELMLEVPPLIISLIGSPASGKSYFLASMASHLRKLMTRANLSFTDASPASNQAIREYENTLFGDPTSTTLTQIRKTETDDLKLYKKPVIDGMEKRCPIPLQFSIWPTKDHPNYAQAHLIGRVLVLYDNAGEDFLPGAEDHNSEAVKHLAKSDVVFMLFDPTQEAPLRSFCRSNDPQISHGLRPSGSPPILVRQETLLREAAVRARHFLGLSQNEPLNKPLIVIIPKFDILQDLPGISIDQEPYLGMEEGHSIRLQMADIERNSEAIRTFLRKHCPDFLATADAFSRRVCYIPVSSLGCSPTLVKRGDVKFYGFRPVDIKPKWVTVPVLYSLAKWANILLNNACRNG